MAETFDKIEDLKVKVEITPKNNKGTLEFEAVILPGTKAKVLAALAEVSKDASILDALSTTPITMAGGSSSQSSRGGKSRKGKRSKGGKSKKARKSLRRK